MKILAGLLFGLILLSLFSGLYFLVRDQGQSQRVVRSLALRVGLSVLLVVLLLVSAWLGWIKPHGVRPPGAPVATQPAK